MKKKLLFISFTFCAAGLFAQKNYWHSIMESPALKLNNGKAIFSEGFVPVSNKLFTLDENGLAGALLHSTTTKIKPGIIISVPLADGNIEKFRIEESSVMEPALQARYNSIHTFVGRGIDDASKTITCSYTKLGFHASIRSIDQETMYVNPVNNSSKLYSVFARNENDKSPNKLQCQTDEFLSSQKTTANKTAPVGNIDDGTLRTFRLALCTTGEWSLTFVKPTDQTHQDSINSVMAALAVDLARANQVYETDLGIHMNLVADEDKIIFLNPSTDPFTLSNLNSKCQQTCDNVIGNSNYDIGHVLAKGSDNGNAGCIGCVCMTGEKGSGMSTYSKPLLTDYFVIDYWTHEMGHQYGANHTFTFSSEGTNAQIEPGSGSTIMGYAGITGNTDVQDHSDDLFGAASIAQISTYIKPGGFGNTCAVSTSTGNHAPVVNAGADRIIPMSTPFILRGSASDVDQSDDMSFIWEQVDAFESGANTFPKTTTTKGPEFRTFNYSSSRYRIMPSETTILTGSIASKWESLSAVSRDLNFRFTARDNHVGGGNNKSDNVLIKVINTAGPFKVTSPNTAVTWAGGSTQTITWDVANTSAAPINCTKVKILYSTNGGQTFKVLKASTPNDGTEQLKVPNVATSNARIAVYAVGNIFFDISDVNFTITSTAGIAAANDEDADDATAVKIVGITVSPNPAKDFFNLSFNASLKNASIVLSDANGKTVFSKSLSTVVNGQIEKIPVRGIAKGNYFITVNSDKGQQTSTVMVY